MPSKHRRSSRRSTRRATRRNGGGYLMPAEYYNPSAHQPSSTAAAPTTAPMQGWVRPPLAATSVVTPDALTTPQKGGSWNKTRKFVSKMSGGFSPALMGSFVANAQTAAVPLALYGLYHMFAAKKATAPAAAAPKAATAKGGKRSRRSTRK